MFGLQLRPLAYGSHPQPVDLGIGYGRRVDGCAALGTESLSARVSAFGGLLYVNLRLTRQQLKSVLSALHVGAERRTGAGLAIRAVAYPDVFGVDFSLISDVAAMTRTVDSHGHFLSNGGDE